MSAHHAQPQHFRFLAEFLAGRPVDIATAAIGQPAYTDGRVVYVSAGSDAQRQRREVLVQSALLGAGSLDVAFMKRLVARPHHARRYLALEGSRVLADIGRRVPLAAVAPVESRPRSASAEESLTIALRRGPLDAAPDWFGAIRPAKILRSEKDSISRPTDADTASNFDEAADPDMEEADDGQVSDRSRILKLFESPMGAQATANFLRKLFGRSRPSGSDSTGAELTVGARRRAAAADPSARPVPTRIRFVGDRPGAALGIGGALHPEWDVFGDRYRPDWCRVLDFPVTVGADAGVGAAAHDEALRRRIARIGLGPRALRARVDGDELDNDALIDFFVDLRSGHTPPEHVYIQRRKLDRNLGVLIMLDASGSANDADPEGRAVHEHQRRAAATLAAALEDLGDRVAVYALSSQGRHAVHLAAAKTFSQRFGAASRARLAQIQPSGYTRLGAGIRGAGAILGREAGTPHRLLLVLSDGYPYDHGYEGRYAEADTRKALEELRADGMGCLCLSVGRAGGEPAPERVFGSASHAAAATLAELTPRMDELFLTALRELSAPRQR